MKKTLLFIAASLFSVFIHAQNSKSKDQLKAEEAVTRFFDGLATLDFDLTRKHCTKDFLLLEDGEVWSMDTLISKLGGINKSLFSRTNHFDYFRTDAKGDMVWMAYWNTAKISYNGQKREVNWLESAVLVKEGDAWKIRMLHSTVIRH